MASKRIRHIEHVRGGSEATVEERNKSAIEGRDGSGEEGEMDGALSGKYFYWVTLYMYLLGGKQSLLCLEI